MSKLRSWVLAVVCAFKSTQSISPVANKYFLNLNLRGINWDTLFVLQMFISEINIWYKKYCNWLIQHLFFISWGHDYGFIHFQWLMSNCFWAVRDCSSRKTTDITIDRRNWYIEYGGSTSYLLNKRANPQLAKSVCKICALLDHHKLYNF